MVAGFLSGAFASATDPREIPWDWFIPALLAGAVGVALIRRSAHATARADHVLSKNREDVEDSLLRIVRGLEEMTSGEKPLPPWEYRFEIDHRFREDLARFADARESLAHLYGLAAYAEIMSAFAAGERYLNRVWSASADGYMDEATDYLHRSLGQFREAVARLEEAHGSVPGPAGAGGQA
jgi:hypothetical protein